MANPYFFRLLMWSLIAALLAACSSVPSTSSANAYDLAGVPPVDRYCLDAQRVVTRTTVPMDLIVHEEFAAFVKSKAVIEGPTIHQYNWRDADGAILGISCKMKSADHLQMEYGQDAAGPDGYCHDMNRQLYGLLVQQVSDPVFTTVVFDPSESLHTEEQANMIGPVWLQPFTLTSVDAAGNLHLASKGFVIDFNDPRYQRFPPSWRGTHYCHLIAPDYLQRLLGGAAEPGAVVGRRPGASAGK
jgi:hypothetical protein